MLLELSFQRRDAAGREQGAERTDADLIGGDNGWKLNGSHKAPPRKRRALTRGAGHCTALILNQVPHSVALSDEIAKARLESH